eukprot:403344788
MKTRKIGIRNENPDAFAMRCLDPEDPRCNPEEFFKEISCVVDLNELYTVISTAFVNDEFTQCPVLLKINNQALIDKYNGNRYLMQVWNATTKELTYQMQLKNPFKNWVQCSNDYLVYITDKEGRNDDCLHILNMSTKEEMLVKGIGLDDEVKHLMYKNDKIFALTRNELRFAPLALNFSQQEPHVISKGSIRTVKPGCPMHGILLNAFSIEDDCLIVAFETPDHQLDFNMLYAYEIQSEEPLNYKWEQYRIVNPRVLPGPDPIKKICNVFYGGFSFCVSLRQSGLIDMYWNMARRDSPDVRIADIAMSIGGFYFKLANGSFSFFKHMGRSNIQYSMCQFTTDEEIDFDQINNKTVAQYCRLYSGFKIIPTYDDTFVVVAHNQFISIYNIELQQWTNHLYFPDQQIIGLFSRNSNSWSSTGLLVDVLCKDGQVYLDVISDFNRTDPFTEPTQTLTGQLIHKNQDYDHETMYTMTFNQDGMSELRRFKEGSIQTEKIGTREPYNLQRNFIPIQHSNKDTDQNLRYYLLQTYSSVSVYQCENNDYQTALKKIKEIKDVYLSGPVHSAVSYDIRNHLFLFDGSTLKIVLMEKGATQPEAIPNVHCSAVKFFNKQVAYLIMNDSFLNIHTGLRLLDLESTLKKKKANMILLKNIDFGDNHCLEYSQKTGRMGLLRSLTQIIICPFLHQNTNKLLGASESDTYILWKKHKDRITTFSTDGKLTTWNLVTGKHVCTHKKQVLIEDLSSYYKHQQYQNLAYYYSNTVEPNMKDEQFFDAWQLQTYADKQATYMKRCSHDYRRWKVIEIKNESEVNVLMEFTFPIFHQGITVYLNDKRDRMILKIINFRTFLYKIHRYPNSTKNEVYFELIRQIVDYPDELENDIVTNCLTFFTPCFSRYLRFDRKTNQFVVRDAINDDSILIPKDIMFLPRKDADDKIKEIVNRVKFIDYSTMLIVNEEGIEKLINIDRNFDEVGYNARPLFNEINLPEDESILKNEEYKTNIYYFEREDLPKDDVLNRLKRKYQEYKSDYYLYKKRTFTEFYENMFTIDDKSLYHNQHSFTFLHWSIIEQLQKKKIKVKDLEDSVIQTLLYNILPGGNTVLHMITNSEKELIRIFDEAHQDDKIRYHVPFLPNFLGESPIHKCVEKKDFKSIDIILMYLKMYGADHHSRCIKDQLGLFVKQQLPQYIDYIDSRFIQTEQIKKFNKGGLKEDMTGLVTTELWFREEDFYQTVMDKDQMETRIKCEFIDLPGIYHYLDSDFQSFFDQLAITNNLDFFNSKAIQNLIDFNYPLCRTFVLMFLFIPFCIFHVIFVVYANAIYEHRDDSENYKNANLALSICLLVFSAYFVSNEIRQLYREGIEYIISVWNYIDLIGPIGVIFTIIICLLDFSGKDIDETMLRCVFSITTLFMWIKLLYFLRIFKATGYLIRLIVEVVSDMGIFLLVLLITLTAFGDAMLRLSNSNSPDQQFIRHSPEDEEFTEYKDLFFFAVAYTYRGILGDFDTSQFGKVATPLAWLLWTVHMLFNMIVMLNLLISIIGDTYERVVDNSTQAGYQEYACLIAENQHLIPTSFKRKYADQNKYLVQVTDLENNDEGKSRDPVINRLDEIKAHMEGVHSKVETMNEWLLKIKKKIDKQVPDDQEEEEKYEDE